MKVFVVGIGAPWLTLADVTGPQFVSLDVHASGKNPAKAGWPLPAKLGYLST